MLFDIYNYNNYKKLVMDIKETIKRVSYIRVRANLSARALSLMIGKNPGYINLLESKNFSFEPSLSVIYDIIEACQSTQEEFFYEDIEKYQDDLKTLKFIKSLSKEQKDAIRNLYNN